MQHSNRCKIVIQTINKPNFPRTCLLRLINYFHNQGIAVLVANDYYELKKKYIIIEKKDEHKRFFCNLIIIRYM